MYELHVSHGCTLAVRIITFLFLSEFLSVIINNGKSSPDNELVIFNFVKNVDFFPHFFNLFINYEYV